VKTLVIGLGNPLLTDDRVGLLVARALQGRLAGRNGVEIDEDYNGGLRLMERMVGFERAIVVDAIVAGGVPGRIRRLRADDMPTQHTASGHDTNLKTALDFGRSVGAALPEDDDVLIIGVEVADVSTFGTHCTPEVAAAVPTAVATVLDLLERGEG
jgi:hydrogenase maturation protease